MLSSYGKGRHWRLRTVLDRVLGNAMIIEHSSVENHII